MLTGPEALTPAEHRIAALAAAGHTNREIAEQLYITLRTVETHLTHAFQKLQITTRAQLADSMTRAGTLTPATRDHQRPRGAQPDRAHPH